MGVAVGSDAGVGVGSGVGVAVGSGVGVAVGSGVGVAVGSDAGVGVGSGVGVAVGSGVGVAVGSGVGVAVGSGVGVAVGSGVGVAVGSGVGVGTGVGVDVASGIGVLLNWAVVVGVGSSSHADSKAATTKHARPIHDCLWKVRRKLITKTLARLAGTPVSPISLSITGSRQVAIVRVGKMPGLGFGKVAPIRCTCLSTGRDPPSTCRVHLD